MITTHVLDTSKGLPAQGMNVRLEVRSTDGKWALVGQGATDDDGRLKSLVPPAIRLDAGVYRMSFDTGAYAKKSGGTTFYPEVSIVFSVEDIAAHFHVPLLLSPYGYSTYRGS